MSYDSTITAQANYNIGILYMYIILGREIRQ